MSLGTESVSRQPELSGSSLMEFFWLVFALAVPLWVLGGALLPLPVTLPVSALTVFVPTIAALIVRWRRQGRSALRTLLAQTVDLSRTRSARWLIAPAVLVPATFLSAYVLMIVLGRPLPEVISVPWLQAPLMLAIYVVMAFGEELGWSGIATGPLVRRLGATVAGLCLGAVWVTWHLVPFLQTGNGATWVLGQGVYTLVLRVLIVYGFVWAGESVFAATLIHAVSNVGWSLFPNYGSHYDPVVTTALLSLVTVALSALTRQRSWGRPAPR